MTTFFNGIFFFISEEILNFYCGIFLTFYMEMTTCFNGIYFLFLGKFHNFSGEIFQHFIHSSSPFSPEKLIYLYGIFFTVIQTKLNYFYIFHYFFVRKNFYRNYHFKGIKTFSQLWILSTRLVLPWETWGHYQETIII